MGGGRLVLAEAPAVSFAGLLDHTARIWRRSVAPGRLREDVVTYTAQDELAACTVRRPRAPISDIGPGFAPSGERVVYLLPGEDLLERDVIELVTGPDAGGTFEVNGPVTRPRGHHIEARCSVWHGDLPS